MLELKQINYNDIDVSKMSQEEFYSHQCPKNYNELMLLCELMGFHSQLRGAILEALKMAKFLKNNILRNLYICEARISEPTFFTYEFLGELCDLSKQRVYDIHKKEMKKTEIIELLNGYVDMVNDTRKILFDKWKK
jgi:hypothetical protein